MPWTRYGNWTGPVNKRRIRVPPALSSGVACFGLSRTALTLRAGAIGTLVDILPVGAPTPNYVRFPGPLATAYAGEVLIRRADNAPVVWADLRNALMSPDETTVLIPRATLDQMEIEY